MGSTSVLDKLGVHTIGQLRRLSLETLRQRLGSQGEHFWKLAHGIDERAVVPDREAKSISHETTFTVDISETGTLRASLLDLTEQVVRRLRRQRQQGRTVHLKVRFADFRTITRSRAMPQPTDMTDDVWQAAKQLLADALPAHHPRVRLLGIGVSDFGGKRLIQQTLFDEVENGGRAKQRQLDAVTDAVREKFGISALSRGSGRCKETT